MLKKLSPHFSPFHQHSEEEMTTPYILIRFIRNKSGNGSTDDVLRISPSLNPEAESFVVKFTPADSFAPKNSAMEATWTRDQVYDHVLNVLTLLTFDKDPFPLVQLDLPLAPSVLFEVSTLSSRLPYVTQTIYSALTNSWPSRPAVVKNYSYATPVRNETVKAKKVADDTYDDMPPLMPMRYSRVPRHSFFDDDGTEYSKHF